MNDGDDRDGDDVRCPFCGEADATCAHVVARMDDASDPSTLAPEWSEIDELLRSIERDTLEGGADLDERARRTDSWWLTARGEGAGVSERLADLETAAARFDLALRSRHDGPGVAIYAADSVEAARRMSGALSRVVRDLKTVARRYGLD
jgi:hypothetical protein